MLETFYATAAQISFALLGLWWVVVQFKYDDLMRHPQRRRTAYNISLFFVLPGAMSLFSLLATEATVLWRVGFGLAGAIGALETLTMLFDTEGGGVPSFARPARWLTLIVYVLIVVFAAVPEILRDMGITPILVEAILLSFLVFLGVQFAWVFFAQVSEK